MESKEIIEGNRLIAEFMGSKRNPEGDVGENYEYYDGAGMLGGYLINFCFHSSQDWLMPVVEKIASLLPDDIVRLEIGKRYTRCNLWGLDTGKTHTFDESRDTLIETVWFAAVQFSTSKALDMAHVVSSFFGKPRCSDCGGVVIQTGYAFPYPQWRCPFCYKRNNELEELRKEIEELRNQIKPL